MPPIPPTSGVSEESPDSADAQVPSPFALMGRSSRVIAHSQEILALIKQAIAGLLPSIPDPNSVPKKKTKSYRVQPLENPDDMTVFLDEHEQSLVVELTKEFSEELLATTSSICNLHGLHIRIGCKVRDKMATDFLSIARNRHRRLREEVVLRYKQICTLLGKVLRKRDKLRVHNVKGSALSGFPPLNPSEPTNARPGSEERMGVFAYRSEAGLPLSHPEDVPCHGPQTPEEERAARAAIDAAMQQGQPDGEQKALPSWQGRTTDKHIFPYPSPH